MKPWSLRSKLIWWTAAVVGVALIVASIGTWLYVQHEQFEALDDEISNEAETLFGELRQHRGDLDWTQPMHVKALLPVTNSQRFFEITGAQGERLFHSEKLGGTELNYLPPGMYHFQVGKRATRLGIFRKDGYTIGIAADLGEINQDTKEVTMMLLLGLPVLVGIAVAGGWWIARKALAPIRKMTTAAEQITAQRLDRRLTAGPANDEIGRLASVLNEMFDRLDRSFRQAARFSADASHELKTPLTILRSGMEDLLESPDLTEADRRSLASLLEQTHRLSSITESLLLLSRADVGRLQLDLSLINVSEIIRACVEDAQIIAEARGIVIEVEVPDQLDVAVDGGRLEQILLNLLDNAVKYNRDGGRVKVSGESTAKGALSILVGNTGPGIPQEHASQLFERFFRSDAVQDVPGHGLGLSIARELARAHGGDLILTRSDAEWTEFNFFIRSVSSVLRGESSSSSSSSARV